MPSIKPILTLTLLSIFGAGTHTAFAAFEAGVLQEYQEVPAPSEHKEQRTPDIERSAPVTDEASDEATTVHVTRFAIEGATLIEEHQLQAALKDSVGRDLSLKDLHAVAARISALYRLAGYPLANAFLPPQTVADGVVKLVVIEGRYGEVHSRGSARLDEANVSRIVAKQGIVSGQPIKQKALERSLLILQNMSATDAFLSLKSGAATGTSDVLVETKAKNLINGQIGIDNHGARYIGDQRITAGVSLNSPFGWGDQLNLRDVHSSDHEFGSASYSLPIGYDGVEFGGGLSRLEYHLCCDFSILDWNGTMTTASVFASYPVVLTKSSKLTVGATLLDRRLQDESLGVDISERRIQAAQISATGAMSGPSERHFEITLRGAKLDLSKNPNNQTLDATTAKTEGSFWKLRGSMHQTWPLSSPWQTAQVGYRLSGQWASRNLDVSEKFMLGGHDGVRAYPQGEGAGDMGLLARFELAAPIKMPLPGQMNAGAFFDAGTIWLNMNSWPGALGSGQSSHYSLFGLGLSAAWNMTNQVTAEVSVATKVGSNKGRIVPGEDSDGHDYRTRAWASLRWDF